MAHKSVLERKRKDPQNPDNFVKICDRCNNAYLERQLLLPFWKNYQKIKVVVDDREKKHEILTSKFNRLEAELVYIKKMVGLSNKNGSKEKEAEQRYSKLEAEQRDITSEFEHLQDDMNDLAKRLSRLETEFIQAELAIKQQRLQKEEM